MANSQWLIYSYVDFFRYGIAGSTNVPVSYTHLDVYKRQVEWWWCVVEGDWRGDPNYCLFYV